MKKNPRCAAVITCSDRGWRGERRDTSGPLAVRLLQAAGYQVKETLLLPDAETEIRKALERLSDETETALIVTTGGTGFSLRDVTPEATLAAATRQAPGIAEAMRMLSMEKTPRAMLSRGVSAIRNQTLIVNLPGSEKAVEECLSFVLPQLEHGIQILLGLAGECGGKKGGQKE